jgi:hypothetical protein
MSRDGETALSPSFTDARRKEDRFEVVMARPKAAPDFDAPSLLL